MKTMTEKGDILSAAFQEEDNRVMDKTIPKTACLKTKSPQNVRALWLKNDS